MTFDVTMLANALIIETTVKSSLAIDMSQTQSKNYIATKLL